MLDIGWSELLVVAVVAIVVVGPKDLPKLMRSFGFYAGKLRRAASDFQRQFDEAMVESEAEEVRKNIEAIRGTMGDKPLMMPQAAPVQNALGEPVTAPPTKAPKPGKRKAAPRAKRPTPKPARAKSSGAKTARAKPSRAKTARTKTARTKAASTKRASPKRRKAKVAAKPARKAPVKARAKP